MSEPSVMQSGAAEPSRKIPAVLYRDDTILVMELHEPEVVHRSISAVERSRRDTGKSSVRVPVMVLGAPVEAPQP